MEENIVHWSTFQNIFAKKNSQTTHQSLREYNFFTGNILTSPEQNTLKPIICQLCYKIFKTKGAHTQHHTRHFCPNREITDTNILDAGSFKCIYCCRLLLTLSA